MTALNRGVRKVSERIVSDGRAIIITEKDKDKYAWSDIPLGSKFIDTETGIEMVKLEGESDWVPAGIRNDGTICIAKDTRVICEVFTIKEIDTDNNTFIYTNEDGANRHSTFLHDDVTNQNTFLFKVDKGDYQRGRNLLSATLNDALKRTVASGGLIEYTNRDFGIIENLKVNDEITVTYAHKLNIGNPYPRIFIGSTPPTDAEHMDLWLDTNDPPYASKIIVVEAPGT